MTHFVAVGMRTAPPGKLSALGKAKTLIVGVEIPRPVVDAVKAEFPQPSRTVRFVARDGVNLAAWDIPAAAPTELGVVVMFHGYAVSRSSLLGDARVLHELGWRTVLVDFRGSGDSEGSLTTLGWREARDVAAAMAWARHEWPEKETIAYGQSMGGAALLRAMATEGVAPDAIVVEAPFDKLLTTIGHRNHAMGLPSFPFAQLLVLWGGMQHGFNAFTLNPVDYATAANCPALVLAGGQDPWVTPAEVRRVSAAMRGPTQCYVFEHGRHCGFWWDVPDEYRRVLAEWTGKIANARNITRVTSFSQKNDSGR